MKKIFTKILIAIALLWGPKLCCEERQLLCEELSYGWGIEANVSGFFPSSQLVRDIYSTVMPCYELEINKTLCWNLGPGNLQPWFSAGFIFDDGHSKPLADATDLNLIPLTLGIKYLFPIYNCLNLYLGIGATYSFLTITDRPIEGTFRASSSAVGGILKSGINYCIYPGWQINLFFDYLYHTFTFHQADEESHLYLSGLKFGAGIGYNF